MGEKVVEIDQLAKYAAEINELKSMNQGLENLNQELQQRLTELHGEYLQLRYDIKGMASQGEVLALRKKILELQNELRLKCNIPQ